MLSVAGASGPGVTGDAKSRGTGKGREIDGKTQVIQHKTGWEGKNKKQRGIKKTFGGFLVNSKYATDNKRKWLKLIC